LGFKAGNIGISNNTNDESDQQNGILSNPNLSNKKWF
jgi:hypothetical protein